MKSCQAQFGRVFVLRLEDGEIVHECIERFAAEHGLTHAALTLHGGADAGSVLVTGPREELAKTLAQHDEVAGMWYFGSAQGCAMVEAESAGNLKETWAEDAAARDWAGAGGQGREFLDRATQIKTIWVPYGE